MLLPLEREVADGSLHLLLRLLLLLPLAPRPLGRRTLGALDAGLLLLLLLLLRGARVRPLEREVHAGVDDAVQERAADGARAPEIICLISAAGDVVLDDVVAEFQQADPRLLHPPRAGRF